MVKIAFVTPWYGPDVPGGAEAETRRTAEHLHRAGMDVEVLTTTVRDLYADWGRNHHRAGVSEVNGVTVRRFGVKKREKAAFDAVNFRLMQGWSITAVQEQSYINNMIHCPDLYEFIREQSQNYIFIFIPYMFATTYFGAQVCPERSIIIPCLHDESYAYLDIYKEVLPKTKGVILHTHAEYDLFERVFGEANGQMRNILGEGVDTDFEYDGARFRERYGIDDPIILYMGRRERGKNTHLLVDYWQRYQQERPSSAKLILMGPGEIPLPETDSIIDLGFVPLQDKYDGLAAADIFCMPSLNESFSLATMEGWLAETPALVHGHCAVTKEQCQRSNGGLYFVNYDEFVATVDYLLGDRETAVKLGQQGRRYVLENFQWPTIIERYQMMIDKMLASVA